MVVSILGLLMRALFPRRRRGRRSARSWVETAAQIDPFGQGLAQTGSHTQPMPSVRRILKGRCWVIDGDTIVIDRIHIRISGIDAPELDHPWGQRAKSGLIELCRDQVVTAVTDGTISHDRAVATCTLPDGRDLAAEMVKAGLALDWNRYSGGIYRHLEPPDARRRLWRADARQKGRMVPTQGKD